MVTTELAELDELDEATVLRLRAEGCRAKCIIRCGVALFFIYRWRA
ncbi:hypothetical protein GCM10027202_17480 [Microvirgula curvata]